MLKEREKEKKEEEQKHEEEKRIRTIPVGPDGLEIVRTPEKVTPEKQTMEKETIQKQIPVKKDLLADDDGGEASVAIDLYPDVTDLTNPFKSVLPMWSHDAESTVLQEQI